MERNDALASLYEECRQVGPADESERVIMTKNKSAYLNLLEIKTIKETGKCNPNIRLPDIVSRADSTT